MLPQPPPNAPAPPPSRAALRSRKRWNALVSPWGIFDGSGPIDRNRAFSHSSQQERADLTEAVSNARQIGLALYEFEQAYGRFPDESTIPRVKEIDPANTIPLGKSSSNDFFRQLIAAEIAQSEMMFYGNALREPKTRQRVRWCQSPGKGRMRVRLCQRIDLCGKSGGNPDCPLSNGAGETPF